MTIAMVLILAGCGGGDRFKGRDAGVAAPTAPMAFGPISKACMASDREARSRRLCGCVQWVADQSLSRSDQRRAAGFYGDPHSAQEIRQSDRRRDERFWKAYSDYGDRAARICG
ncbi:hypothetical protein [Roseovarius sp. SYSU LYC5161]|uniref:hypothetical protein n=1 Tax=Roseovarius halophilus (ex Wu et al. 2025) TaxID=3376060 RepID=UPI0028728C42|nr:hypothetical protein [Roseovarius sp.]